MSKIDFPLIKDYVQLSPQRVRQLAKDCDNRIYRIKPPFIKKYLHPLNLKDNSQNNLIFLIEDNSIKNEELNLTTDYFNQSVRINCRFCNKLTPYEYYQKHKTEFDNLIKNSGYPAFFNKIIQKNKNENYYACNLFRISIGLTIMKYFKPKKVLDISAGWGDRLLISILSGVKYYYGADPNQALQPGYQEIIKTFVPKERRKFYRIDPVPFEKANIPKSWGKFNLLLTSPPFFDKEEYFNNENKNVKTWNSYDDWFYKFLIPSVLKAAEFIIKNGLLILYVEILENRSFKPDFINHLNKSKVIRYIGSIYYFANYSQSNNSLEHSLPKHCVIREMLVFKKLN